MPGFVNNMGRRAGWAPAAVLCGVGAVVAAAASFPVAVVLVLVGLALASEVRQLASAAARGRLAGAGAADPALLDDLTGVPNRTLARDRLGVAVAHAARTGDRLALLRVDVDRLEQVNQTLGHEAGDTVLRGVAERLGSAVRPEDTVARIGGDEFLVICPAVATDHQAHLISGRVVGAMAEPLDIDGSDWPASVSVGMVTTTGRDTTVDELLRDAGDALSGAKRQGRGRIRVVGAAPRDIAARAARDLDQVRAGMEFGDLVMEYQPIIDIGSRRALGFEALARWRHPERGIVPAADFLPVVEASDLAVELARLAIGQACRDGASLQSADHQLTMHVNLSLRHLELADAVDDVGRALDDSGLPASLLTLELPPGPMPLTHSAVVDQLRALRDLGVALAISLGNESAAFRRFAELPIDVIKLDRSIVAAVDTRRAARAVSAGVLAISEDLGVAAIAEGIETAAEEDTLVGLGYRRAQGNRFSAALPRDRLESWA